MPALYDSDFSEESSAPPSDSDYDSSVPDSDERQAERQRLKAKVPPFCVIVPKLLTGRFVWHCPGQRCRYAINMLRLTDENTQRLAPKMVAYLKSGEWADLSDQFVQAGFRQMVDMHYDDHCRAMGVIMLQRKNTEGKWEVCVVAMLKCLILIISYRLMSFHGHSGRVRILGRGMGGRLRRTG